MSEKAGGRGTRPIFTDQEALLFHSQGRPGKIEVVATKPMATQRDLSLAYSPGVAVPVKAIAENPDRAYDYTAKGNFVAVITNGTAILGMGNLGALAAKPVMEGKAVLFKRFADVDAIDLEVSTEDPDAFVNCVRYLGQTFGGINLEDIKAPECFLIEQRLRELLDVPVFHDDQHGTAIIAAAGLLNALDLTGREIGSTKLVCNGAGAAGIACLELLRAIGFKPQNVVLCDTKGVIYRGRQQGMNQWKSAHAVETKARSLAEALAGADVFFGLSAKGAVTPEMVKVMAAKPAVARAAMDTGVARKPIIDMDGYRHQLRMRLDPVAGVLARVFERLRRQPKRVVFAEGEEEQVIRAATNFVQQGLGTAQLVGREERVRETAKHAGIELSEGVEIFNARLSRRNSAYAAFLYERLQRQGYLFRDCQRLINQDRNHFAAAMVALGDADAMVTGVTRNFSVALEDVRHCIDVKPGHRVMGFSLGLARGRTVVVADTAVTEMPEAEDLAEIAVEAAGVARKLGYEPRLALLAFSNFGQPPGERAERIQKAVRILDQRRVDFEYDGEMSPDVALSREKMAVYPFCRLSGPANVLIMPAFHSASISTKMLQELGGATVIGPLLVGLDMPVQIVQLATTDSDLVNMAALAAYNVSG